MADDEVKPDEQALLAAWRGGDAAAGQALFRRHYVGLSRFFRSKAGEAAYELTQATFLACLEGGGRYRGEGSLRGYLLGIAYHKVQKLYAERERRAIDVEEVSVHDLAPGPSTALARRGEQWLLLAGLIVSVARTRPSAPNRTRRMPVPATHNQSPLLARSSA